MKPYKYVEYAEKNITKMLWFFKGVEISKFPVSFRKLLFLE